MERACGMKEDGIGVGFEGVWRPGRGQTTQDLEVHSEESFLHLNS